MKRQIIKLTLLRCMAKVKKIRWTSVAEELRTYPFLNPTLTLTSYQLTGVGRGKCAVAQILILIHKITVNNLKVKG